ncbi:hypothetical protein OROGR_022891 [Orobanche gracilis]
MSGADLKNLMNHARLAAVKEDLTSINTTGTIRTHHFEDAFSKVCSSVSDKQRRHYRRLSKRF